MSFVSGFAGTPGASRDSGDYRPHIDALRALAVTGVLYTHFWDKHSQFGHLGVRLFFVISGYLITAILLRSRDLAEDGRLDFRGAISRFFARRILRIFPAYYTVLVVAALINAQDIQAVVAWHATHTSNILFAIKGDFVPWVTAHLWSLSIEEQFYLLWPFVVLLTPARFLTAVVIGTILFSIGFRIAALSLAMDELALWMLTPASLDALAAGALLALVERRSGFPGWLFPAGLAVAGVCVVVSAVIWVYAFRYDRWRDYVLLETLHVVPMAALVAKASNGFQGTLGRVFSAAPVLYLGRISFGVYLYHLFVVAAIWNVSAVGLPFLDRGPGLFVVASPLTILIAALSWHWLEQPCTRLKQYFPYREISRNALGPRIKNVR